MPPYVRASVAYGGKAMEASKASTLQRQACGRPVSAAWETVWR